MSTLRFLFILLLLLNVLAFATLKGWLGGNAPAGEPERLNNQLAPERIQFLRKDAKEPPASQPAPVAPAPTAPEPAAAAPQPQEMPGPSPAVAEASQCRAWIGLNTEDASHLAERLRTAGLQPRQSSYESTSAWWVRIPPQGSREAAERKVRELKALGVTDYFIVQDAGPTQFAVSLGLFKTENAANQQLTQLRSRGVRSAGVTTRSGQHHRVEVSATASALAAYDGLDPAHRGECKP